MTKTRRFRAMILAGALLLAITGVFAARAAAPSLAAPAAASGYSFTSYAYPHDTFTQLLGINNGDRIAGYHGATVNKGFEFRLPNVVQDSNYPNSAQTQVIGINNIGDTVGFYIDGKGVTHGFYHNHRFNKWYDIDVPGTHFNQLLGVNDHGGSAGYYQFGKANIFQPYTRIAAGTYSLPPIPNAQMTDINNGGNSTGFQVVSSSVTRAFVILGGAVHYFQYPGATFTQALGLNNSGLVVGTYNDKSGTARGYTYNLATHAFRNVSVPGSTSTVVNGVNDHDWIVGFYTAPNKNTIGFVGKPK